MGCQSYDVVTLDFGPLLHGQMRIGKLKSAYASLTIGSIPMSSQHIGNHEIGLF